MNANEVYQEYIKDKNHYHMNATRVSISVFRILHTCTYEHSLCYRKECLLCDAECESVSHVLWDCPAYASIRSAFMLELRRELGDSTFRVLIVLRSHLMS